MNENVTKIIDGLKDKELEAVLVVGLDKDNGMVIESSVNNVALMHWMLNRSIFDINLYDRNAEKPEPKDEKTA
jgi:hypothetical protein